MKWDRKDIESFLGEEARIDGAGYVFSLPFPSGEIDLCIYPEENRIQIFDREFQKYGEPGDPQEALSSYIHCTKMAVDYSDGPDCGYISISGSGGGVCISRQDDYYAFFFSMGSNT